MKPDGFDNPTDAIAQLHMSNYCFEVNSDARLADVRPIREQPWRQFRGIAL